MDSTAGLTQCVHRGNRISDVRLPSACVVTICQFEWTNYSVVSPATAPRGVSGNSSHHADATKGVIAPSPSGASDG